MSDVTNKLQFWSEYETLHTTENSTDVKLIIEYNVIFACSDKGYLSSSLETITKWIDSDQEIQTEKETNEYLSLSPDEAKRLRDFLVYALSRI